MNELLRAGIPPKTDKAEGITFGLASVGDGGLEPWLNSSGQAAGREMDGAESDAVGQTGLLQLFRLWLVLDPDRQQLVLRVLKALVSQKVESGGS